MKNFSFKILAFFCLILGSFFISKNALATGSAGDFYYSGEYVYGVGNSSSYNFEYNASSTVSTGLMVFAVIDCNSTSHFPNSDLAIEGEPFTYLNVVNYDVSLAKSYYAFIDTPGSKTITLTFPDTTNACGVHLWTIGNVANTPPISEIDNGGTQFYEYIYNYGFSTSTDLIINVASRQTLGFTPYTAYNSGVWINSNGNAGWDQTGVGRINVGVQLVGASENRYISIDFASSEIIDKYKLNLYAFEPYTEPGPTPLSITLSAYNTSTQEVILIGTCSHSATSSTNQLRIQGFDSEPPSGYLGPDYPGWGNDPWGNWRGELADCTINDTWTGLYQGGGLSGTKWIGVLDFQDKLWPITGVATTTDFSFVGIDWSNPANFITQTSTSTGNGLIAHQWACTEAEWNATSTFIGINLGNFWCHVKESFFYIGFGITNYATGQMTSFKNALLGHFPFNIISNMKGAYDSSTSIITSFFQIPTVYATSSPGFATTTGVFNGNFTLDTNLNGTPMSIKFLDKSNITDLIGENGFNALNIFIRIVIWALFVVYCYDLIVVRFNDLTKH